MPILAPEGVKVNSLVERAMLAEVKISKWAARKHDKFVSKEVAKAHGLADENLGTYRKQIVAKKAMEKINKIASDARDFHYKHTLPWNDNGQRILVNVHFQKYCDKMRELKAQWDVATREFIDVYPKYQEEAKTTLGTMYRDEDYPTVDEMSEKFDFVVNIEPMPTAADYRVHGIIDQEVARIKEEIEERQAKYLKEAMKEPYRRLQTLVTNMSEKLKAYKRTDDGKLDGRAFHDTLVGNLKETVDLIPGLNLTNDQALEDMRQEVSKELTQVSAETLREDPVAREDAIAAADKILDKLQEFI